MGPRADLMSHQPTDEFLFTVLKAFPSCVARKPPPKCPPDMHIYLNSLANSRTLSF